MTEASPDSLPCSQDPCCAACRRAASPGAGLQPGPARVRLTLLPEDGAPPPTAPPFTLARRRAAAIRGRSELDADLAPGAWTGYRFEFGHADGTWTTLDDPALCYPGRDTPGLRFAPEVRALLHGSCRKPHHAGGGDGLARADAHLKQLLDGAASDATPWPAALVLSGDGLLHDVGGPIATLMRAWACAGYRRRRRQRGALHQRPAAHPDTYYRRERLPRTQSERLIDRCSKA